jgi:hypothetical protein
MFCGNCGKETESNSQFCIHCGNKLLQDRSLQSTPVRSVPVNHQPSQKIVAPITQTTEIVGCQKTAVSTRYPGVINPKAPPYSVITSHISVIIFSTVTTYKIFNVEYDKSESSEKIWKCPHCNEEVKVINRKAGKISQEDFKRLEEQHYRSRSIWKVLLPAIIIVFWALVIISPNKNGIFVIAMGITVFGFFGLLWAFAPFKGSVVSEEQEFGYVFIENPQTHSFLVSEDSSVDLPLLGYESPQPITPESRLQNVGKIIHKVWVKSKI